MATVEENDVLGNVRWTYICLRISLNILVVFFVRLKPTGALQKVSRVGFIFYDDPVGFFEVMGTVTIF